MSLSQRITLGLVFFALLLSGMYTAGFYAHSQLSQTIDYVTGPAWETADGAMEATIEIEHGMLLMGQLMVSGTRDRQSLDDARASAKEAIERMVAASLLEKRSTDRVLDDIKRFRGASDSLWLSYTTYLDLAAKLNQNTSDLAGLSTRLEEQGDAAVESIEQAPDTLISWNTGLSQKWMAADGGMEASIAFYQQRYLLQQMVSEGVRDELQEQMNIAFDDYLGAVSRMRNSGLFGDADLAEYDRLSQKQVQLMADTVDALSLLQQDRSTYQSESERVLISLAEIEEQADGQVEGQLEHIAVTKSSTAFIMAAILVVCLALLGITWVYVRSRVIRLLHDIAHRMKQVASGDGNLSLRLPSNSQDELGDICRSFNRFAEKISGIVETVNTNNQQLEAGISTSAELANRISAEASGTADSCSSATREIEAVRKVAGDIAGRCSSVAQETRETGIIVSDSQKQIENAIRTTIGLTESVRSSGNLVKELKNKTDQIDRLVSVIADISEQTNLLALNAAIEAARAGEQGRGFAVVADEVRNLATRSASSSQEIGQLIRNIVEATDQVVQIMTDSTSQANDTATTSEAAGKSMHRVLEHMRIINEQVQSVADAAEQQSRTLNGVTETVDSMARKAGRSSSGAQESVAVTERLKQQSQQLSQAMSQFQV